MSRYRISSQFARQNENNQTESMAIKVPTIQRAGTSDRCQTNDNGIGNKNKIDYTTRKKYGCSWLRSRDSIRRQEKPV